MNAFCTAPLNIQMFELTQINRVPIFGNDNHTVSYPTFWGFQTRRHLYRMLQKRAKRDILETALLITISKFRKHFSIQTTPQNLGKITSETTFSHSKVVFRPLLRIKLAFSQNPPIARF